MSWFLSEDQQSQIWNAQFQKSPSKIVYERNSLQNTVLNIYSIHTLILCFDILQWCLIIMELPVSTLVSSEKDSFLKKMTKKM